MTNKHMAEARIGALASLVLAQSMAVALIEAEMITPDALLLAMDSIADGALMAIGETGDQAALRDSERIVRRFTEQLVSLRPAFAVGRPATPLQQPSVFGLHSLS